LKAQVLEKLAKLSLHTSYGIHKAGYGESILEKWEGSKWGKEFKKAYTESYLFLQIRF